MLGSILEDNDSPQSVVVLRVLCDRWTVRQEDELPFAGQ